MPDNDPATEGREAYLNGEPLSACPYEGDEAAEWEGAWMEAEEEGI